MKFTLSNHHPDLAGEVRLTIDTSEEAAIKILHAAVEIVQSMPDPVFESLRKLTNQSATKAPF